MLYVGYSLLISFLVFILTGEFDKSPCDLHGDADLVYRYHRLLLELAICAKNLWIDQDRLNVKGRTREIFMPRLAISCRTLWHIGSQLRIER